MERTKFSKVKELKVKSAKIFNINGKIILRVELQEIEHLLDTTTNNYIFLEEEYRRNLSSARARVHANQTTDKASQKLTLNERNELFIPLAEKLYQIVFSKKKIKFSKVQLKSWATEIR